MKRAVLSLALTLAVVATMAAQTQEYNLKPTSQSEKGTSTTRIEKQHPPSASLKKRLKQTEKSILAALEGNSLSQQQTAIQTLRDLEQIFPEYPFEAMIAPLGKLLRDEKADLLSRTLAALALDELHSPAGDAVIQEVAGSSGNEGLRTLCTALLVRTWKE